MNPDLLKRLREILGFREGAALARDVAGEMVRPRETAERLGALPHYERTEEVLRNPSVDSLMALSGGAKPGVFVPATRWAGRVVDVSQAAGASRRGYGPQKVAQMLTEVSQTGMYNPLTKRVSFPASLPQEREREAAIKVAATKYGIEREGSVPQARLREIRRALGPVGPAGAAYRRTPAAASEVATARKAFQQGTEKYPEAFGVAYNFLTESARNPQITERDIARLATESPDAPRIARLLLTEDLFSKHPLARRRP